MTTAAETRVFVIIPALNEALVIADVVNNLRALRVVTEVVVCDNGSTDATARCAREAGATVVYAAKRGYGAACLAGLGYVRAHAAPPDVVLFADGDGSVVAADALALIARIEAGYDLAIGVRVPALQERGALTLPQRVGNVIASWLIYALWRQWIADLGPLRAVRASALWHYQMQDETFGWTVEMQIKALQAGSKVAEVPVATKRRVGKSKISGTIAGVIGAGSGIIGKIFALKWAELAAAPPPTLVAPKVKLPEVRL